MENTDQILDAPPVEEIRLRYAGFWIRVAASIIDGILLSIVQGVVSVVTVGTGVGALFVGYLINLAIGIGYYTYMESSENQATLGKMAVGIKVGNVNGEQLTFANALGRYFAKILSFITFCIGFMMVGWDEKNQGLHDKLADTYVFYR